MQIELNTDMLPEEMTEAQVYDAVESSLMVYLGEFAGAPGHEERCRAIAHVWKSLIKPAPPAEKSEERTALEELNSKDLAHLRFVAKQLNGYNDYMQGWKAHETSRAKLKLLGLVTVNHFPAAGMGDVSTVVCKITKKGRDVIRQTLTALNRR